MATVMPCVERQRRVERSMRVFLAVVFLFVFSAFAMADNGTVRIYVDFARSGLEDNPQARARYFAELRRRFAGVENLEIVDGPRPAGDTSRYVRFWRQSDIRALPREGTDGISRKRRLDDSRALGWAQRTTREAAINTTVFLQEKYRDPAGGQQALDTRALMMAEATAHEIGHLLGLNEANANAANNNLMKRNRDVFEMFRDNRIFTARETTQLNATVIEILNSREFSPRPPRPDSLIVVPVIGSRPPIAYPLPEPMFVARLIIDAELLTPGAWTIGYVTASDGFWGLADLFNLESTIFSLSDFDVFDLAIAEPGQTESFFPYSQFGTLLGASDPIAAAFAGDPRVRSDYFRSLMLGFDTTGDGLWDVSLRLTADRAAGQRPYAGLALTTPIPLPPAAGLLLASLAVFAMVGVRRRRRSEAGSCAAGRGLPFRG
jgi:hypothetical protein